MLRMLQEVWQRHADDSTSAGDAAVQLNFVSTETICRLHAAYFDDPAETDVITFPLQGPGLAGEIYICTDRAISQARQYGISVDEELARLAVHGVLHLLGFDDLHPKARRRMRELERRYLKMFSMLQREKKSG